jgi:hypothetical protein
MIFCYVSQGQLVCDSSTEPFSTTASNAWDCVLEAFRSRIPILTSASTLYFLHFQHFSLKALTVRNYWVGNVKLTQVNHIQSTLRSSPLRIGEEIRPLTTNTWIQAFGNADIGIRKKIASRTPDSTTATEGLSGDVNSMHAPLIKD